MFTIPMSLEKVPFLAEMRQNKQLVLVLSTAINAKARGHLLCIHFNRPACGPPGVIFVGVMKGPFPNFYPSGFVKLVSTWRVQYEGVI